MPKHRRVSLALLVVLLCAGCITYDYHDTAPLVSALLTGSQPFEMASTPGNASFVATNGDSGGVREIFWPSDNPELNNAESCATWTTHTSGTVQQGAALRIRRVPGGVKAITVTKNIWLGAYWIFNFHVWNSATGEATLLGGINLADEFVQSGVDAWPPPWYLCARAYGATLEFKAWRAGQTEPAYGDPHYGGYKTLPSGWDYPGASGWYIGHAPTNSAAVYSDLVTRS